MGLFDKLRGIEKAASGVAPVAPQELGQRILGINRPDLPFLLEVGPGGAEGDIVVQWKIVDAQWTAWFSENGLTKVHRIFLALNPNDVEVRAVEESWDVEWRAGVPNLTLSAEAFRGRTLGKKEFGGAIDLRRGATGENPEVYRYNFDVAEMKKPIIDVVTGSGWNFRPVMSKRGLVE